MTRKRFVKLMMAAGVSRNEANEMAERAVSGRVSYSKAYSAYTRFPNMVGAIRDVAETIRRMAIAMCEATTAFTETFAAYLGRI